MDASVVVHTAQQSRQSNYDLAAPESDEVSKYDDHVLRKILLQCNYQNAGSMKSHLQASEIGANIGLLKSFQFSSKSTNNDFVNQEMIRRFHDNPLSRGDSRTALSMSDHGEFV